MPSHRELRTCPVTGTTVLVHPGWPDRPLAAPAGSTPCWGCSPTTPTIQTVDGARAVPHPVPLLGVEGSAEVIPGPAVRRQAVGAHELLLGQHDGPNASLLRLARERMTDLRRDLRLRGFGLCRLAAPGAHAAWQLLAFPFDVAPSAAAGWRDRELTLGERVVARAPGAVALAAWAPLAPFETWILPVTGVDAFAVGDDHVGELLDALWPRFERLLGPTALEVSLVDGEPWRLVLRPRVRQDAVGLLVGLPVVGVSPEEAAARLRE